MINYLKGEVLKIKENSLILNVAGVGYKVIINQSLRKSIKENALTELYIYTQVSENNLALFGFLEEKDLDFFEILISVSGIGPKSAISILEGDSEKIKSAIINNDLLTLVELPGIGKKTAERMVLELKNKIKLENLDQMNIQLTKAELNQDAIHALVSLGYSRYEANTLLKKVPVELTEVEEIIKHALKN